MKATLLLRITALAALCATAIAAPESQPAGQKLAQGKAPGTFHLVYRGSVRFTMEPQYPTVLSLDSNFTGAVAQTKVVDAKPFTLEADLPPGAYSVMSVPVGKSDYWPANSGQLFIDKSGNLTRTLGLSDVVVHVRKMSGLSPSNLQVADADAPVLKWDAVPGAKVYRGDFGDFQAGGVSTPFEVKVPQYKLPKLQPPRQCAWEVWAMADDGHTIASGFGSFYPHGTVRNLAKPGLKGGYLGVAPMAASIAGQRTPAIRIGEVVDGSPAAKAGLRADDLIVAVDGKPVGKSTDQDDRGNAGSFVVQIRAIKPGAVVTLTVRRDAAELKIPVTVGATPPAPVFPPIVGRPLSPDAPPDSGYLGIMPTGLFVTKDPRKTEVFDGGGVTFRRGEMIPCIMVSDVAPGSPALAAGLRPGDIIVALNGKPITSTSKDPKSPMGDATAFLDQIRAIKPGMVVTLTVRRASGEVKLPVTIGPATKPATRAAGSR